MLRPTGRPRKASVAAATDAHKQQMMLMRPAYTFRGHSSAVHVVRILRRNLILLTGDADGWVVLWNLVTRRPVVVWRAHRTALLNATDWGDDKIITHGRDSTLIVWQLLPGEENSNRYSSVLPFDEGGVEEDHPKPLILHSLTVNTLNFCPFAMSSAQMEETPPPSSPNYSTSYIQRDIVVREQELSHPDSPHNSETIFIAVPSTRTGQIDIYQLPTEDWVTRVPLPKDKESGMIMQIRMHEYSSSFEAAQSPAFPPLVVVAGYENGSTSVFIGYRTLEPPQGPEKSSIGHKWLWDWREMYTSKPHGAPIIGLDVSPRIGKFFTSSADNVVAMHDLPKPQIGQPPIPSISHSPKHSVGSVSSSGQTTAPTTATTSSDNSPPKSKPPVNPPSLLSQAFKSAAAVQEATPTLVSPGIPPRLNHVLNPSEPLGRLVTEFTGQQDLCLRGPDHDILATAGWDGNVHVYETKAFTHLDDFKTLPATSRANTDDGGGGWSTPAPASALARNPENPGRVDGFMTVSFSQIVNNIAIQDDYGPVPTAPVSNGGGGVDASAPGTSAVTVGGGGSIGGATPASTAQEPISIPARSIPTSAHPMSFLDASPTARVPAGSIRDRHQMRVQKSSWIAAGSKNGSVFLWEIPEARWKEEDGWEDERRR